MKELIEEKKFEMRAYDKVELALLYCPGRSAESALLCHRLSFQTFSLQLILS